MDVPLSTSFNEYQARLQQSALVATKQAFQLPRDIQFHRTLDKSFASELDNLSARVVSITDKLLRYSTGNSVKGKGKAVLKGDDGFLDNYHIKIVDVVDQLFENADKNLDAFVGRGQPAQPAKEPAKPLPLPPKRLDKLPADLLHASHLPKPQLSFKTSTDTSSNASARRLTKKYNAQLPLGQMISTLSLDPALLEEDEEFIQERSSHPYIYETLRLKYPKHLFQTAEPIHPNSYESTPFTWVDSVDSFQALLAKLRLAKEIAVDLEYHSLRSYYGFVCLMQISTREEDWIIDTLVLREELEELNEVFTNPSIIKVFHGAESDIVWLQQDFNLYVVNLFDTYHASVLLGGFPKNGLASLLNHFCQFEADKRYQLADWRIRPLPEEMLFYARSDTHFLLYIYDCLRNMLLEQSGGSDELVRKVLRSSNRTSLQVYTKELYDVAGGQGNNGWDLFLSKFGTSGLENYSEVEGRKAVVVAVHIWRDRIARELDEGTRYVLSNHLIYRLANSHSPPDNLASLLVICSPAPPIVRERATELLDVIRTAKLPASLLAQRYVADTMTILGSSVPFSSPVVVPSVQAVAPDLWSANTPSSQPASRLSAPASSFLGHSNPSSTTLPPRLNAQPQHLNSSSFTVSTSTLFGPVSKGTSGTKSSNNNQDGSRRRELIAKVVSTLHINLSVPAIDESPEVAMKDFREGELIIEDPRAEDILELPTEVEFVPAAERSTLQASTELDPTTGTSVVVVGRKRGRKKKNAADKDVGQALAEPASTSASGSGGPSTPAHAEDDIEAQDAVDEVVAFDYSSVPNILDNDDNDENAQSGQKRGRKRKNKQADKAEKGNKRTKVKESVAQYDDFPAPPRNRAETRAGNRSITFK